MKKILLLIAASIMSISNINAQNLSTEVVAGMNLSNLGGIGSKVGFHAGARFELALPSLAKGVYTNAGLLLTSKGSKLDLEYYGKATLNAYFLEVPIHIGYKYTINDNFAIFGEGGPYVGFGLFGKYKTTDYGTPDYEGYSETVNTFDSIKRFDVGLGLRVGVEFKKKYSLSVSYDWGLMNSVKTADIDLDDYDDYDDFAADIAGNAISSLFNMKHTNLMISLGYKF